MVAQLLLPCFPHSIPLGRLQKVMPLVIAIGEQRERSPRRRPRLQLRRQQLDDLGILVLADQRVDGEGESALGHLIEMGGDGGECECSVGGRGETAATCGDAAAACGQCRAGWGVDEGRHAGGRGCSEVLCWWPLCQ